MTILQTLNQADQNRCIAMLDGNAKSDIELFCRAGDWTEESGIVIWIDITVLPVCPVEQRITENAIWWCQLRDLFVRHPTKSNLIRFREPTREQYEKPAEPLPIPAFLRQAPETAQG
jgi:hypothetical protein